MRKTACVSMAFFVLASAAALAQPNLNPPNSVFELDQNRDAIHRQTGLVCPVSFAGWPRVGMVMFDKVGLDVSCSYRGSAGLISIYLTRVDPAGLNSDFESSKQSLLQVMRDAVPDDKSADGPSGFTWLKAGYSTQNGAVHSDVLLAQVSGWELKFRATYNTAAMAEVNTALAALGAGVARTAAPNLAACAAAPLPARNGKLLQSPPSETIMAAALGTPVMTALPAITGNDPIWCVEQGLNIGGAFYLYWRNIAAAALVMERITPVLDGPVVYISKLGLKDTAQTYYAWIDGPEEVGILEFFEGRPALNQLPARMLGNKPPAYAQIGKNDRKVTIIRPK